MKIRIDFDNESDGELHEIRPEEVRIVHADGPTMFGGNIGIYEIDGDEQEDFDAFYEKVDGLSWAVYGVHEVEIEAGAEAMMVRVYDCLDSEDVLPDAETQSEAMVEATFREAAKVVGAPSAEVQGDWEEVAKAIAAEIGDKFPEFMAAVEVIGREQAAANQEYNSSLDDPNEDLG